MSEGGAMLAHSGGGFGLVFGGLVDFGARGNIHATPFTGMGYGAGVGWLAASALATQIEVKPGRVLSIDLGAFLGGLGGAALASPLLFDSNPTKERGWVVATGGATVLGGAIAWYLSRESSGPRAGGGPLLATRFVRAGLPTVGVIGESPTASSRVPIVGLSWSGTLLR
jgi:hypothetical protein